MRSQVGIFLFATMALWGQNTTTTWKEFSIGPATKGPGRFSREGIRGAQVPVKRVLAKAFGLPEHRILGPDWIASQRYALTAIVSNPDDFQPLMQQEFTNRFLMLSHRETRELPVYVLKPIAGTKPSVSSSGGGTLIGRGSEIGASVNGLSIKMAQSSLDGFAAELEDTINRPVFNESGIDGLFDITLSWDPRSAASLIKAVKNQLGCDLVEERRNVELLVIDRIEKPRFDSQ